MKSVIIALTAVTTLAAGCVVVPSPPPHREQIRHDRDRDGVPNRYDRDRDGDGVRNRDDRRPNDPRRY